MADVMLRYNELKAELAFARGRHRQAVRLRQGRGHRGCCAEGRVTGQHKRRRVRVASDEAGCVESCCRATTRDLKEWASVLFACGLFVRALSFLSPEYTPSVFVFSNQLSATQD